MKRKIVSIITALALCLGLLPGTARAAGNTATPLDFTNVGDSEGQTPATGAGYTWDETSNTLTLNGLNLSIASGTTIASGKGAITLPENSTLVIEGTSNITVEKSACVWYSGALTVKGAGILNLNLNASYISGFRCATTDWASASMRLESGTLKITGSQTATKTAALWGGTVTLCGADVTATNVGYGIGNVYGAGGAETVIISGGSLTVTSESTGSGICLPLTTSMSETSSLSITGGTVDISGISTAIDFGKGSVTVSGGTLNIHNMRKNGSGYSWAFNGYTSSSVSRQLNLLGGNISISDCVELVSIDGASVDAIQIDSSWGLSGLLSAYRANDGNTLNQNEVRVYGDYAIPESRTFAGNQNGIWVIDMTPGSTLTIPAGVTVDMSALKREYSNLTDGISKDTIDLSAGTVINNGTLKFPDTMTAEQVAAWDISGSGTITIGSDTYTNSGQMAVTKDLDFSDTNTPPGDLDTDGYHWDATDKTLHLKNIAIDGTVTLPGNTEVTVITEADSTIKELLIAKASGNYTQPANVVFEGPGELTIQEEISNGCNGDTITVAAGAKVVAEKGIGIGDSGVDSTVTVNGKLTANSDHIALICGKVVVNGGGELEVSSENIGVSVNGMYDGANTDFTGAFTVDEGGSFSANCTNFNIYIYSIAGGFTEENAKTILVVPDGYLPSDCEVTVSEDGNSISIAADGEFTISRDNIRLPDDDISVPDDTTPSVPVFLPNFAGTSAVYPVTVERYENGAVDVSPKNAERGQTVTLTVTPDEGYELDTLTVTDSSGEEVPLTARGENVYTFTMPGSAVTVTAIFASLPEDVEEPSDGDCPSRAFTDLDTNAWYHEATDYVLRHGLMSGYDNGLFGPDVFGPDDNLSRAMLAQILYNREGQPAVTDGSAFTDAAPGRWYTSAVTWAAANGIVGGYGDGRFGPNDNITREQLAVMLWRYAGSPAATSTELRFTDVGEAGGYALAALCWAVENDILSGYGDGRLNPVGLATRAQAAQMLKNFLEKQ